MSGCNLIMRRDDYLRVGGMDESLYIGEDADLGRRVSKAGYKILFSPEVVVFHKNRSFVPFLIQRYARGMATAGVINSFIADSFREKALRPDFRWELFMAPGFIVFMATGACIPLIPLWGYVYSAVWILFVSIIGLETFKNSERLSDIPGVFATLLVGTICSGFGAFFFHAED
jgi:cellulose synthase/poly-beta-1,6-N-acetylglucosamine synthase-like glycosyltransferase